MINELPHDFPIHLHTRWLDFSPALHWHARTRIRAALRAFRARIRWVTVRIADAGGVPGVRRCEMEVMLAPTGRLSVSASDADPYRAVAAAARRARVVLRRHLDRTRAAAELPRIA